MFYRKVFGYTPLQVAILFGNQEGLKEALKDMAPVEIEDRLKGLQHNKTSFFQSLLDKKNYDSIEACLIVLGNRANPFLKDFTTNSKNQLTLFNDRRIKQLFDKYAPILPEGLDQPQEVVPELQGKSPDEIREELLDWDIIKGSSYFQTLIESNNVEKLENYLKSLGSLARGFLNSQTKVIKENVKENTVMMNLFEKYGLMISNDELKLESDDNKSPWTIEL